MAVEESEHFMVWAVLAFIGFLVLVAVVIALGTGSTGRYERERRAQADAARPGERRTASLHLALPRSRTQQRPAVQLTVPITLPAPASFGQQALPGAQVIEGPWAAEQERATTRGRHRAPGQR